MFLVSFVVLLGLVSSVSAIVVDDTQTWTGKLSINGGTLEIGPNGNLTIPDNERHELINGAHLILNGGTMTVHGQRLRCETGSTITLNSGYLRVNTADGLKFPDDPPGPCTMYLYGGTLSTTWVQPFAERGSRFIVGGGTLQVDTTPLENTEPQEWVNQGMITLAPGYIEIVATSNSLSAIIKPSSYPYDRAENVPIDVELSWEGAEAAVSFDVYFGTDPNDVNDANTTVTLGAYQGNQEPNSFNPGGLQLNETYYWRIDEVNDASIIHKGDVWSFTTITRLGLEDCESYTDTNALTAVWAGAGGASIELSTEQHHQGEKSLQLGYDNSPGSQYSEIGLTFDDALDWASSGASALGLYFKGLPTNDSDRMYFVLEDATGGSATVTYNGNMNDLKKENWQPLGIILRQFTGVDLSAVKKFVIGIGDRGSSPSGGSGTVYFDDIALCMSICIPENGPVADFDGDCMVNSKDFAIMARDWLESGAFETDLYEDCKVDLKDCAVLADSWLIEQLSLVGESPSTYQPGLAWVMFHSSDFTRPGGVGVDSQIDIDTGTSINDYSNIWVGF